MMDLAAKQISTAMVANKDQLITEAINNSIGKGWTIGEIAGRGEIVVLPDKTETFVFDGVELLRFWPPVSEIDDSGMGIKIKATQQYMELY